MSKLKKIIIVLLLLVVSIGYVYLLVNFLFEEPTNYKGVVVSKGYELPTSGYKRHTDTKYIIYMREDITHKVIRVNVTVPIYFELKPGDRTNFNLTNDEMYYFGNINKRSKNLYGK